MPPTVVGRSMGTPPPWWGALWDASTVVGRPLGRLCA
ncbi:hypothetical protein COLO4_25380 [Corchorus olitorius]|uniref:Uncharacterized protein n=1 Tax=Corchorus olitorius TaxID=93759 RepID=A0A1R3I394_9ROSI|nr:hypothetical protein COLO4_25380 [Corchorus olitorius]